MLSIGLLGFLVWSQMAQNLTLVFLVNLAICLNNYNNSLAGNFHFGVTPEIISEGSFNFLALCNTDLAPIDHVWLQWFIGFVEGDGSLITNRDGSLTFVITQSEKAILDHIQSTLGFGQVVFDQSNNCWRFA